MGLPHFHRKMTLFWDNAAADANAISLHPHLGPRGAGARRRTRRNTQRCGGLVCSDAHSVALEGGDEALHAHAHVSAKSTDAAAAGKHRTSKRRGSAAHTHSTDDFLARTALDAGPTQLKDTKPRCAHRKVRKGMRRLAAALVEAPGTPTEFEGFSGSGELPPAPHKAIPAPFLQLPDADALAHLQAAEDKDAADLDAYARLAPSGAGGSQSQSRSSGRSSGSGSGAPYSPVEAMSSTLVSPPPSSASAFFPHSPSFAHPARDSGVEFGAFTGGVREGDDFDGTPGGFDSRAWA
ncbi:hypothetical protein B0H14DRAFT_3874946 [Mycena olivaceomarginata]|nr:hypothetical protein B0H14DRAFT_3874946 [Mycena olivaceomarginata]